MAKANGPLSGPGKPLKMYASALLDAEVLFEKIQMLQPGELHGEAVVLMANHARLQFADTDQNAQLWPFC